LTLLFESGFERSWALAIWAKARRHRTRAKRGIVLFKANLQLQKTLRDRSAARGCARHSLAGVR